MLVMSLSSWVAYGGSLNSTIENNMIIEYYRMLYYLLVFLLFGAVSFHLSSSLEIVGLCVSTRIYLIGVKYDSRLYRCFSSISLSMLVTCCFDFLRCFFLFSLSCISSSEIWRSCFLRSSDMECNVACLNSSPLEG